MKRHLYGLTTIAITAILGACSGGSSSDIVTLDIAGNLQCEDTGDISDLLHVEWTLLPELTDSTMLSSPKVVGYDGDIVYLNQRTRMLRYDGKTGRCLTSFDNSGEGPGHYQPDMLDAYKVPTGTEWMVYEYNSMKRYIFSADGVPESETNTGKKVTILPCGDGWLTLNDRFAANKVFTRLSQDFQIVDSIVAPFPVHVMKEGISHSPLLSVAGKDVIFLEKDAPADTLFAIGDKGGMKPLAAIELGNLKLPQFDSYETYREERDKYLTYNVAVAGNLAVVTYGYDNKRTGQIYSLKDGKLLFSRTSDSKEAYGLPIEVEGHIVYGIPMPMNGEDAMYLLVRSEFTSLMTGDEESNPMIVKARL